MGAQLSSNRFRSGLDARIERSADAVEEETQRSRLTALEGVLYAQDTWQPAPQWVVMPGLRASFFDGYAHLNPRLSVQYTVRPGQLLLRGGVGTRVQYLHRLRDRYSFLYDLVSSRWIPASDAAAPSQSVHGELGLEGHPLPWLTLTAETYARGARGVLVPEDVYRTKDGLEGPGIETGALLAQVTCPPRRALTGVELAARAERGPWWVWLSYAGGRFADPLRAAGRKALPARPLRRPPLVYRGGGASGAAVERDALGRGRAAATPTPSPSPATPSATRSRASPSATSTAPPSTTDVCPPTSASTACSSTSSAGRGRNGGAGLHLYNLLNHRNVIGRSYDPGQPVVQAEDRRGLPILPLLELEMEL